MIAQSAIAALAFLPLAALVSLWVAWSDMARMKIPNRAVLALLLVYAVIGPFVLPLPEYGWRWVHFGAVLLVGFLMNMLRLIGAGDAKFAAAMAPFVALGDMLLVLYLFAGVLLAAFICHRIARAISAVRRLAPNWESWHRTRDFPMGLALGGTLIAYLAVGAACIR
ncbi:MAG: hypothetical protein CL813_14235 [Confluentimicrobium sp.]|nr:hypothetical protein [Actibacterium sp.]MBF54083.1 hypothetical protein [Actibacterium sp.]|tara:strand:+ start:569 stop:1069 length:501 start_codon:yes stop_codon:yes gene_type:complete